MTTNYHFKTIFNDLSVAANAEAALNEAGRVFIKTPNARGSVFCQLQRTDDGQLSLTGAFIEHEYAERMNAILRERKQAMRQQP